MDIAAVELFSTADIVTVSTSTAALDDVTVAAVSREPAALSSPGGPLEDRVCCVTFVEPFTSLPCSLVLLTVEFVSAAEVVIVAANAGTCDVIGDAVPTVGDSANVVTVSPGPVAVEDALKPTVSKDADWRGVTLVDGTSLVGCATAVAVLFAAGSSVLSDAADASAAALLDSVTSEEPESSVERPMNSVGCCAVVVVLVAVFTGFVELVSREVRSKRAVVMPVGDSVNPTDVGRNAEVPTLLESIAGGEQMLAIKACELFGHELLPLLLQHAVVK